MESTDRRYFRIVLGKQHSFAQDCFENNFVGVDYSMDLDLKNDLPDNWREFNKKYIPTYLEKNPGKSKVTAGLACGAIHTMSKAIKVGDYVLCPDGKSVYQIGEISGDYFYREGGSESYLRHCRPVKWLDKSIKREEMSDKLKNSSGSALTLCNLSPYSEEIKKLLGDSSDINITSVNPEIEDPSEFALEKHLEDFLVTNWEQTELAENFDIYEDDEFSGQQFPTDTGPIDILAISKDKKELVVVELKKGRASDSVVGQVQRYMGYVKEEVAEENQTVKGIIIAFEEDLRIKRALSVTQDISFYRYRINFSLTKD